MKIIKTHSKAGMVLFVLAALSWALPSANANTYFSDNFQSGLGQWVSGSGGVIVSAAPTYPEALTFNRTFSGGDIFSMASVPGGSYLSFDYEGSGGFIGVGGHWLAGESGWSGTGFEQALTYDHTWRHYSVFVPNGGNIMMEIFSGVRGSTGYSAEFANIVDASTPVPESTSLISDVLLLLPFGSCAVRQLRKKLQAA